MATVNTLHSHKYQHFENLQLSTKEFYDRLEQLVAEYQYPDIKFERVTMKEGHLFSASREYLIISRRRQNFYVCAAPFGKSYFISWYHFENANIAARIVSLIPWIGKSMSEKLESKTWFQYDSELMFLNSISMIIKQSIASINATHGFTEELTQ